VSTESSLAPPLEELALFNPAFLALLVYHAARDYGAATSGRSLPLPFAYVLVPVVLHRGTRELLPRIVTSQMAEWTQAHPELLAEFPDRVRWLVPLVGEACCFAIRYGVLIGEVEGLRAGELTRRSTRGLFTTEVEACIERARFCGRWFARQPDTISALAMWGLRP